MAGKKAVVTGNDEPNDPPMDWQVVEAKCKKKVDRKKARKRDRQAPPTTREAFQA